MPTPPGPPPAAGRAVLSLFDVLLLAVGCTIGSGVFFAQQDAAQRVQEPAMLLGAWLLGGLVALTGALCYAELGGMYARSGGVYVFLREAFGVRVAFLFGWATLLVIAPGAIAYIGGALAAHLCERISLLRAVDTRLCGSALILLFAGLNACGVRWGSRVQNLFTLGKLAALALLVCAGLAYAGEPLAALEAAALPAPRATGWTGLAYAMVPVLFSYGGWQNATFVAAEVRQPSRNMPLGLMGGALVVIATYLLVNYAYLQLLTPAAMAESRTYATRGATAALGELGGSLVWAGIATSLLGVLAALLLANPRVLEAMGADGLVPGACARLSQRTGAPTAAIWLLAGWSCLLLWVGRAGELLDSIVFADWLFFSLCALALFVLRRRAPDLPRPYRTPLYPLTPALFLLLAAAMCAVAIAQSNLRSLLLGAGMLLVGLLLQPWLARWATGHRQQT